MIALALVSLAFSGWMAWTVFDAVRSEPPADWRDSLGAMWGAVGAGSGILVAGYALFKALV